MPLPDGTPTFEVLLTFTSYEDVSKYNLRSSSDQEATKWFDKLSTWKGREAPPSHLDEAPELPAEELAKVPTYLPTYLPC